MTTHVLAGDIGGTKTDLGIYAIVGPGKVELAAARRFDSRGHDGLESILEIFLRECGKTVAAAAFGVAGPVFDQTVEVTNLPWRIERDSLARIIGTPRVRLLNDLAATGYGALFLPDDQLHMLNAGEPRRATCAVIAAGTGLGEGYLMWTGDHYLPVGSEGGHADFAPRNAEQMRLLEFLAKQYGHVSVERLLSGPGLENIFRFVADELGVEVGAETSRRLRDEDAAAVIGEQGLAETCRASVRAVDLFLDVYGAEAGNLALKTMAVGGVFVGGGPAIKLLPRLRAGGFLRAFFDKGRFEEMMRKIPVRVILNPQVSQLGAAHAAVEIIHR
jgi:glucokinase